MAEIPADIQALLRPHIAAIARIFKAPRITLIVRAPEGANVKGDLVISNDNPTLVLAALRARMVAEAEIYAGEPERMNVQVKEPQPDGLRARGFQGGHPVDPRRGR